MMVLVIGQMIYVYIPVNANELNYAILNWIEIFQPN